MTLRRRVLRLGTLASDVAAVFVAQALYWLAFFWRRALRRTTFVAITGTHGKTTAKEMLAAMLASGSPTFRTSGNQNTGLFLTRNILGVRPRHRFAVIEIGVGRPGEMRRLARLVRPDVAVILTVLRTHVKMFRSVDAHAAEKAVLLEEMRPGGVAVLNADDPRVIAMAGSVRGRAVTFGSSTEADVWAEAATSAWPERLEFDVRTREGEACHVRTRLVGTHWRVAATAALAVARSVGVPLEAAAAALADVEPCLSRMQPMLLPLGAVVLRDDFDGSIDTFEAGMRVLGEARAQRRIAVIADVSEFGSTKERKRVAYLGQRAARVADLVVFVGHAAKYGRLGALESGLQPENAYAFDDRGEAAGCLRSILRPGDFVYLKGRRKDNLGRLFFALLGPVRCTQNVCNQPVSCDRCAELGIAPEDAARARPAPVPWAAGSDGGATPL